MDPFGGSGRSRIQGQPLLEGVKTATSLIFCSEIVRLPGSKTTDEPEMSGNDPF